MTGPSVAKRVLKWFHGLWSKHKNKKESQPPDDFYPLF